VVFVFLFLASLFLCGASVLGLIGLAVYGLVRNVGPRVSHELHRPGSTHRIDNRRTYDSGGGGGGGGGDDDDSGDGGDGGDGGD
jgi:hypothetical protein